MGDQQGDAVGTGLRYVPADELRRLRELSGDPYVRHRLFSTACRLNTLYMIARAGSGHIGSSFSSIDIVTWLHLERMGADDVYFSSKGHDVPGLYSTLIAMGRLDEDLLHRLRRLGGLPGHPDVGTAGIPTNTGSLGMGVSKAKGMIFADRLAGRARRYYVLTGDGELQEGQFWESLPGAVNARMGELTVVVDHNKLQSDTFVTDVLDLGDLEAKFTAYGFTLERCDGHDAAALEKALESATEGRPHVVIADTVKGQGVSFMEHTAMADGQVLYGYHSGAPRPDEYHRALIELTQRLDEGMAEIGEEALRLESVERPAPAAAPGGGRVHRLVDAYSAALVDEAALDERIVALDADLILDTGLIPFRERFPQRFVECGIAEQDMVSQAGGMAAGGLLPVVHSFACFLTTRPNEQIYNNATEGRRIIYVGSLAGLLPAGPGHSHQSLRDGSAIGGVPGLIMVQPASEEQTRRALRLALSDEEHSYYLRLVTVPVELPFELADDTLQVGRGQVAREGIGDIVVFACGPVALGQAYRAIDALGPAAERVRLLNLPFLNRIDEEWLGQAVDGARHVVTVDDHYLPGGMGSVVGTALAELGAGTILHRLGLERVPACGAPDEVLEAHRLDASSIASRLASLL